MDRLPLLAVALLVTTACAKDDEPSDRSAERTADETAETTAAVTAADRVAARKIFETRCTVCHGATGKGDGPGSAALDPKPRDFTDPAWQKEVTDEHIEKIVVYGGAAVSKSPAMPPNPDLQSKPGVVQALRQYVRGLGP